MDQPPTAPRTSEALRSQTGRDYDEWFQLLDGWGAPGRPYAEIAAWLTGTHGMTDWWAQKLIVEYEQLRGLREPGARPNGTFTGGASKTIAAPADRILAAFTDPALRRRWLPELELSERTSRPGRSARFDVTDGSRLNVAITARPGDESGKGGKGEVAVEHERLPDAAAADRAKADWRARLTTLKALLEAPTSTGGAR